MKKFTTDSFEKKKRKPYTWDLSLYVLDESPTSIRAMDNVKRICEEHLSGRYNLEVIDLAINPQFAKSDDIVAVPTLVRKLPPPGKKIIGDLTSTKRVLTGLDLLHAG